MKTVLFVCVHNAGRSQMAEAFFNRFAQERGLEAAAASAGTAPGQRVNPVVAQAMAEVGVSHNHLPMLAEDAMKQTRLLVNNPREMTYDAALSIYEAAL